MDGTGMTARLWMTLQCIGAGPPEALVNRSYKLSFKLASSELILHLKIREGEAMLSDH